MLRNTLTTSPVEGSIKLNLSTMTGAEIFTLLDNVNEGLTTTTYYPHSPALTRAAVTAGKNAVLACMQAVAAGEMALRTKRAALEVELNNGRNVLRSAAATCESLDRTDEALVSVGWTLRRPAGRPRPVPAPAQLSLKNTAFEGEAEVRWTRVPNVSYYEVKAWNSTTGDSPDTIPWESVPVIPGRPASLLLKDYPVSSYLTIRVRAVGAKGPSPWTENATVRIY